LGIDVAGSVVQVVNANHIDTSGSEVAVASTSNTATGIKVTITPKYVGSKIVVTFVSTMNHRNAANYLAMTMFVNGSPFGSGGSNYTGGYIDTGNSYQPAVSMVEHTTTSLTPLTFEVYARTSGASGRVMHPWALWNMNATEIAQ
jgi:hypothetical protein